MGPLQGTDILVGDPLGKCDVSQEGVVQRDLRVFQRALTEEVPICMVLAGGSEPGHQALCMPLSI